ncbi:MAG: hypothetical protein MUF64_27520 [Polyangiaceae bacterium]|nr:hypothetical protein [Polyangiaceae bacterium]
MPVYAYDAPPHFYVRLAPQLGADLAVVGPLPDGAFEHLLGEPQLLDGLHRSCLVLLLLDLRLLPSFSPAQAHWTLVSFARHLVAGGSRHLALVLPEATAPWAPELSAMATQVPGLSFAAFFDPTEAARWLAAQIPGVGPSTTPEEVRADAVQGDLLLALARYRALTGCSLADALAVVENLLQAPPPAEPIDPTSLVPSTEVPLADPAPAPAPPAPPASAPSAPRPSLPPSGSPAPTQTSLGEQAASASQLATAPTQFEDALTTARDIDASLFPSGQATAAEDFLSSRLRDLETLLRSTFTRTWFVASQDGDSIDTENIDDARTILLHELNRPETPLELAGPRLVSLFRQGAEQLCFSPGSPAEITLRRHQLPLARDFLSGILIEEHLDLLLSEPRARERFLAHPFLVLLERSAGSDRVLLSQGPAGRDALLFSSPDLLARFLHHPPLSLASLCVLAEQSDSLLEKLLILPLDGVVFNPGSEHHLRLARGQLKQLLRPGNSSPEPIPPAPPAPSVPVAKAGPSVAPPKAGPSVAPPAPPRAGSSVAPPPPEEPRRLRARSLLEAQFYLDARGFEAQERYQWREQRGTELVWSFLARGPAGRQERIEFTLDAENHPQQDGYFGAGPSPLFGPVELVQRAGAMSRSSSGSPLGLSAEELARATHAAEMAYLLVLDALRHYGPEEAPPASALLTEEERQALARDPARFQRSRVEETARAYWYIATQLGEALRGKP